ncbi:MAG: hypothetical protein M1826_001485 [Phylliscum demangeonii]|nr:MAG: hypothetical protein M1826_001485 [Phylliscum demangeonii]
MALGGTNKCFYTHVLRHSKRLPRGRHCLVKCGRNSIDKVDFTEEKDSAFEGLAKPVGRTGIDKVDFTEEKDSAFEGFAKVVGMNPQAFRQHAVALGSVGKAQNIRTGIPGGLVSSGTARFLIMIVVFRGDDADDGGATGASWLRQRVDGGVQWHQPHAVSAVDDGRRKEFDDTSELDDLAVHSGAVHANFPGCVGPWSTTVFEDPRNTNSKLGHARDKSGDTALNIAPPHRQSEHHPGAARGRGRGQNARRWDHSKPNLPIFPYD